MEQEAQRIHDYLLAQKQNAEDYDEVQTYEDTDYNAHAVIYGFNLALDLSAHIIKHVAASLGTTK